MKRQDFYTRTTAETGARVTLPKPDGSLSDEWVVVVGMDSDRFRKADLEARRATLSAIENKDSKYHSDRDGFALEQRLRVLAKSVVLWSFDETCDEQAVLELLREAPYVADLLDKQIAQRALFQSTHSGSSSSSPGVSSN